MFVGLCVSSGSFHITNIQRVLLLKLSGSLFVCLSDGRRTLDFVFIFSDLCVFELRGRK